MVDSKRPRLILKEQISQGPSLTGDLENIKLLLLDDEPCLVLVRPMDKVSSLVWRPVEVHASDWIVIVWLANTKMEEAADAVMEEMHPLRCVKLTASSQAELTPEALILAAGRLERSTSRHSVLPEEADRRRSCGAGLTRDSRRSSWVKSGPLAEHAVSAKPQDVDRTYSPAEDFYKYVNASWLRANPCPPDRPSYCHPDILQNVVKDRINKIIAELQEKDRSAIRPLEAKVCDFYTAAMDEDAIEAAGIQPLQQVFTMCTTEQLDADLSGTLGTLCGKFGVSVPFAFTLLPDTLDPN